MDVASLVIGFVVLVALLIIGGMAGGIGTVELLIWLALVVAWIAWWTLSRRRDRAAR